MLDITHGSLEHFLYVVCIFNVRCLKLTMKAFLNSYLYYCLCIALVLAFTNFYCF